MKPNKCLLNIGSKVAKMMMASKSSIGNNKDNNNGDADSAAAAKEARKKKIRELEASLFGGDGNDSLWQPRTDLPQLQNVGEYSTRYVHSNFTLARHSMPCSDRSFVSGIHYGIFVEMAFNFSLM